jgi:hypothetical protein
MAPLMASSRCVAREIEVEIIMDMNPEETSWYILYSIDNYIIAYDSPTGVLDSNESKLTNTIIHCKGNE